ncbi:hypothetical protein DYD83_02550 [Dickeya fangzhongdai]|uniref:Uncharacterized protein n=1 Tax=Dickeya fangzhongdai TaxID=1778540 RepID=A0A2K8QIT1_9GAMM|nr:hypothetical protein CVE23_02515 [Dickeya fangzhongdai]AYH46671.1 hypothetical protein B6N31_02525 [Dickeya fangzhongdai]QOH46377.1 hypothetical protein DYD82_02545 [Dickeya fangzhongdai]QOH50684.1 hypothetical protein DYD83_02550 [Dickeya fangzhongdai]
MSPSCLISFHARMRDIRCAARDGAGKKRALLYISTIEDTSPLYPPYFKPQRRWLRSLTRITYLSKLIGIRSLAAFLSLEIYWVSGLATELAGIAAELGGSITRTTCQRR